jgi:hypothetical protein
MDASCRGNRATRAPRRWAALAVVALAVTLAACGGSTVDQSSEVTLVHKDLGLYNLPQAKSVDCPSDVSADVGTTFVCQATLPNGQEVALPSRINAVHGDTATLGPDPAVLQQGLAISAVYKSVAGVNAEAKSVDCPSDQPAKANATFECHATLTNGLSGTYTLRITRAGTNGQNVEVIRTKRD